MNAPSLNGVSIELDDYIALGNVDNALAQFYVDQVTAVAAKTGVSERLIREWFERDLISEQGFRTQVLEGPGRNGDDVLRELENAHLIRADSRRGTQWYEISHDRLVAPIKANNAAWRETRLNTLQREASEWERRERPKGLLISGDVLSDAEKWANAHPNELLPVDRAYLKACQENRRIERRNKVFAVVLVVLLITVIAAGVWAFIQRNRAEDERKTAKSGELSLTVTSLDDEQLDQGLLLSQEAIRLRQNPRSVGSLLTALRSNPQVVRMLQVGVAVQSVAATADGRYVAGGAQDGTVRVWEVESGREVGQKRQLEGEVRHVVFSPDGTRVAAAGSGGVVRQWRFDSTDEVAPPFRAHKGTVRAMAYDPSGEVLATGGDDHVVLVWDANIGRVEQRLTAHADWVNAVAFADGGATLLSAAGRSEGRSVDRRIIEWDVATGTPKAEMSGHTDAVRGLAVSPDGSHFASAGADGLVFQWNRAESRIVSTLTGNTQRVFDVAFSPDGRLVASAGRDHTVRLWEAATGIPSQPLRGHGAAVRGIAFAGNSLVTGGNDGRIFIWDVDNVTRSRLMSRLPDQPAAVRSVAVSPNGRWIATGSVDGSVVFRGPGGSPKGAALALSGPVNGLAFSPDSKRLATITLNGSLQVWDVGSRRPIAGPTETGDDTAVLAWSPLTKRLASGGSHRLVRIWNSSLQPVGRPLRNGDWITAVAFRASDGALLATGADGVARVWLPDEPAKPHVVNRPISLIKAGTFLADGQQVATGDIEGVVTFWPSPAVSSSAPRQRTFTAGKGGVTALAASDDGKLLAVGHQSGSVYLLDVSGSTAQEIGELGIGSGPVYSLAFSPDGSRLVSGDDAGSVLWDIDLSSWKRVACDVVGRNLYPSEQKEKLGAMSRTCPGLPAGVEPPSRVLKSDEE
jgi:WD40 repeat protein